jgi:diketogulonate reductase-like aldo/keto reductase
MPQIGLGTYDSSEGDVVSVVKAAILEHGYRHIDTAKIYWNEDKIGEALAYCIKEGGVKREDLFITTKLWQTDKFDVEEALRKQLKSLQLDYLDLYITHWTIPEVQWKEGQPEIPKIPMHKVWEQLERCVELGLVKSIGVSNCQVPTLIDILTYAKIKPVVNQIELHPYLVQKESVEFQRKLGVEVVAYAPLGAFTFSLKRPEHKDLNVFKEPLIQELAQKYNRPLGQIVLNWHLSRKHLIIPKTSKVERLLENISVYDFEMTPEEYEQVSQLDKRARFYDPCRWGNFGGFNHWPYFDY